MSKFFSWLTEQSTIKAIIVVAGIVGYTLDVARLEEVLAAVGLLYSGVAAFVDRS